MGTAVNGIGISGAAQSVTAAGALTIKNTNDAYARMAAMRKTGNGTNQKKRLNYNHREISGQLVRAKKVQNASNVLTRAKSKLAVLQRQAGSGQYDSKETANAIAHARRMVRCAQLKVRNLKEEEREQKSHNRENRDSRQQKQNEVKRRVAQKEREIKSKVAIEEMQDAAKEKRKHSEMMQKRRMHRNQERSRINEADMKYIKGMIENNQNTGNSFSAGNAVLDLSMEAAALAEVQMIEQAQQQIEAEVEAEIAAEMAMGDAGAAVAVGGSSEAGSLDTGMSGADAGGTVDVAI